jgi:UDP-N-acetyl-D-glucosamine dehydrogenase
MELKNTLNSIEKNSVRIEVFGLGYVGFPLSVRLTTGGLKVRGIDIDIEKITRLEKNELMESELFLKNEFIDAKINKKLELAQRSKQENFPKIGIICVPTPIPQENRSSNIFVKAAVEDFLQTSKKGDIIILESSVEGGTTEKMQHIIESKGYKVGVDFGLCFCPERIDPQNKKWNLENIPRIIYSSDDITFKIIKKIYHDVNNADLFRVSSPKIAEVVKSYENAFRLVNISLVNELAILCDKLGINVKEVINAASTKPFGFMPFYPGAGAGGHCIPKDPRFLLESAKNNNLEFSTIQNALEINENMPKYVSDKIEEVVKEKGLKKNVLVCGLSYKPDVEDMRDSSGFKIMLELKKRNFEIFGYDYYYKPKLLKKYLQENSMKEFEFVNIKKLDNEIIKKISCLCIVQHHTKNKLKINEIYEKSLIPFIYDCQNQIKKNNKSKSILYSLGNCF